MPSTRGSGKHPRKGRTACMPWERTGETRDAHQPSRNQTPRACPTRRRRCRLEPHGFLLWHSSRVNHLLASVIGSTSPLQRSSSPHSRACTLASAAAPDAHRVPKQESLLGARNLVLGSQRRTRSGPTRATALEAAEKPRACGPAEYARFIALADVAAETAEEGLLFEDSKQIRSRLLTSTSSL